MPPLHKPTALPPVTTTDDESAAVNKVVGQIDHTCKSEFYRKASRNTDGLPGWARTALTIFAMVLASSANTNEAARSRKQVAKIAAEVLRLQKSLDEAVSALFPAAEPTSLIKKAQILTKLSRTRGQDQEVLDLAWCHVSSKCALDASQLERAERLVQELAALRPNLEAFRKDEDERWWPFSSTAAQNTENQAAAA